MLGFLIQFYLGYKGTFFIHIWWLHISSFQIEKCANLIVFPSVEDTQI